MSVPDPPRVTLLLFFFFNDTAPTEIYTLSLHDALPILHGPRQHPASGGGRHGLRSPRDHIRSEEHTSELQSHVNLVCRLLLEKKKKLVLPETSHENKLHVPATVESRVKALRGIRRWVNR